jgi:hypothetical protein
MDATRFDNLLRALFSESSRRHIVAGFINGLLGMIALTLGGDEAQAKRCPPCRKKKKGKCKKKRPDGTPCGGGKTCQRGRCVCPDETEPCGGACVPFCDLFQARNPVTCDCCLPNNSLLECSGSDNCCSGICLGIAGFDFCVGRAADEPCDFDAQCASSSCVDETCAAP